MVVARNEILFAYEEWTASCLQTRSKRSGNTPFSAETNNKSLGENTKCVKRELKLSRMSVVDKQQSKISGLSTAVILSRGNRETNC
jgi:hypothetical protein